MARFKRLDVFTTLIEGGLSPLFYHHDLDVAKKIAGALAQGGSKVLEFTNRGDFAFQIFAPLAQWCEMEIPELILGVGSIVDPGTAALYINLGANFIVGPVFNTEVAKVCNRRKVAYLPGCGSATEISQAEEYGAEICKVFPGAEVGGPNFIKNLVNGPMPWSLLMPTGGVERNQASIEKWFKAGAACVGMGSNLIPKDLTVSSDFEAIARSTAEVLQWIRDIRKKH